LAVSRRDFEDFEGQILDAVEFLSSDHSRELLNALAALTEVERTLEFGIAWLDVTVQCDYLPPDLVALAGRHGIGIVVAHYPVSG
jgi:hypothetical protein